MSAAVRETCRRLEQLANEALLETPLTREMAGVRQRLLEMRDAAYALGVDAGRERRGST